MIKRELIKAVVNKIDSLVDFTKVIKNKIIGSILELADGYLLMYGLDYLNEKYGDKIPAQYVDEIELALQKFVEGDYLGMLQVIPEGFNDAIDIACFDDDFEAVFIATNFNALIKAAQYYAIKAINKNLPE